MPPTTREDVIFNRALQIPGRWRLTARFTAAAGLAAAVTLTGLPGIPVDTASAGPAVSAHAGVTVSAALPLDAATLLTPFLSVALKGDVLARGVVFTDSAGTSVTLPVAARAPHATLALGVDLVRTAGIEAGLRADLDVEPGALRKTVSGNVRVPF